MCASAGSKMATNGHCQTRSTFYMQAFELVIWITCMVLLMIVSSSALEEGNVVAYNPETPPELQFCTFFNNRAPEVQPDLENCTWFRDNSCCRQIEIDVTFRKMKALPGASEKCQRHINYLMCYICSPIQHRFYIQQRLTVCEDFCDDILKYCKTALLKGRQIGELFSSGKEFCESRRLYVMSPKENQLRPKCFNFSESMDTTLKGKASRRCVFSQQYITLGALLALVLSGNFLLR